MTKKQVVVMERQNRCYDFRMSVVAKNGVSFTYEQLGQCLMKLCKKVVFQIEKGEKSDYLHFQGRISLIKSMLKMTFIEAVMKIMNISKGEAPQYVEPTVKGVVKTSNFNYVLKEQTRVSGPWTEKDFVQEELKKVEYIPRQYRNLLDKLYPYQKCIYNSKDTFDIRGINIVIDPIGNQGKSTIASLCELFADGIDVPPINDYKELIQLVCDECIGTNNRSPSPILIDMPRGMEKSKLIGIYTAIEQIKKGKLFDTRNKYKKWWIDSPQIWVFTNEEPDLSYLSSDRWKIWDINNEKALVEHVVVPNDGLIN